MRCLHCGKRLPLLRKWADEEFCSRQHRQEYLREQQALALSRLVNTPGAIERADSVASLARAAAAAQMVEPPQAGHITKPPAPRKIIRFHLREESAADWAAAPRLRRRPAQAPPRTAMAAAGRAPMEAPAPGAFRGASSFPAVSSWIRPSLRPRLPAHRPRARAGISLPHEAGRAPWRPAVLMRSQAGWFRAAPTATPLWRPRGQPLPPWMRGRLAGDALAWRLDPERFSQCIGLADPVGAAKLSVRRLNPARRRMDAGGMLASPPPARRQAGILNGRSGFKMPLPAPGRGPAKSLRPPGLRRLALVPSFPPAREIQRVSARIRMRRLSLPAPRPLRPEGAIRIPTGFDGRAAAAPTTPVSEWTGTEFPGWRARLPRYTHSLESAGIALRHGRGALAALPQRAPVAAPGRPLGEGWRWQVSSALRLRRGSAGLAFIAVCPRASERRFYLSPPPQASVGQGSRPRAAGELRRTLSVTRYPVGCAELVDYRKLGLPQWVRRSMADLAWSSVAGLWKRMPAAAKGAGMAAVALSAAVLSVSAAGGPLAQAAGAYWGQARKSIAQRAAIALSEDFRSGLANWEGERDPAESWSYDQAGFVRIGELALYKPTMSLSDYRMEFVGQIEKKALGWVARAQDTRNYYAMRLTQTGSGAVPTVVLERYPVVNGKAGKAAARKLNMLLQKDTLYEVALNVSGEDYSLTVQGKIVDSWREHQLQRGGVGFFTGKGEQARLRWVGVWHQYDAVGRLCALLAPSGLQGQKGSLDQ